MVSQKLSTVTNQNISYNETSYFFLSLCFYMRKATGRENIHKRQLCEPLTTDNWNHLTLPVPVRAAQPFQNAAHSWVSLMQLIDSVDCALFPPGNLLLCSFTLWGGESSRVWNLTKCSFHQRVLSSHTDMNNGGWHSLPQGSNLYSTHINNCCFWSATWLRALT